MPPSEQQSQGPGVFKDGNPLLHGVHRAISWAHLNFARKPLPDRVALYFHQLEAEEWPRFREAVQWLQNEGYQFVGPDAYLQPGGKKAFLSFDDNHHHWWECLPLFDELKIICTFYVNSGVFRGETSESDLDRFFNRIAWFGERKTLSKSELKEIASVGHVIGAHTHTHRALNQVSIEQGKEEIRLSQEILAEVLNQEIRHFSFPYGMPRFLPSALRSYCAELEMTVADATPGMLHAPLASNQIHRTLWRLEYDLPRNQRRMEVDGRRFLSVTGKSPIF